MTAPAVSTTLATAAARARAGQHIEPSADASWPPLGHAAVSLSRTTGAPLADVLEAVAEAERASERRRAARDTALAGPRASARLLRFLPAVGLVIAAVLEPGALRVLAATPLGWVALALGGTLAWAGTWWLRRMEHRAAAAGAALEEGPGIAVLLVAALQAGLDVRSAIGRVGEVTVGETGTHLTRCATQLDAGSPWKTAWGVSPPALAGPIEDALSAAWTEGMSPVAPLKAASRALSDEVERAALMAARELDTRSALPVALCLLPAFVIVGIVPMVVALAAGAISPLT